MAQAGVREDGQNERTEAGTPQGAVISPLLRTSTCITSRPVGEPVASRHASGTMIRCAMPTTSWSASAQGRGRAFLADLEERMARFALDAGTHKTRLMRSATARRRARQARSG